MSEFKNIFLHYLNKDTQEIFSIEDNQSQDVMKLLSKSLNASVLLCADYCLIPLGFYFESQNTKCLIQKNLEYIAAGLLRISLREEDINEYVEKKQSQLMQFASDVAAYRDFYDTSVISQISELRQAYINRDTQIGEYCVNKWMEQSFIFVEDSSGDMSKAYKRITDNSELKKVFAGITDAVDQVREGAFVWKIIDSKIKELHVSDASLGRELRRIFEKYYYQAYLEEYNADILENIFFFDKGLSFDLESETRLSNFGWYSTFLSTIGLDFVLDGPAFLVIELKKTPEFAIVNSYYSIICNDKQFSRNNQSMTILTATYLMGEAVFNENVRIAKEKANTIIINGAKKMITFGKEEIDDAKRCKADTVDVLILIATEEEEAAILKNDDWEECVEEGDNGFTYFVREETKRFALVRAGGMREGEMSAIGQRFIDVLHPKYIAMAGFCAGREGKVALGDVVVADTMYRYGEGKETNTGLLPEINSYSIPPQFKQRIQRFGNDWISTITLDKPIDYEKQKYEILRDISELGPNGKINPGEKWDRYKYPNFPDIQKEMLEKEWITIEAGNLQILQKGYNEIQELFNSEYWNGYQTKGTSVVIGPMACGDNVEEKTDIFDSLVSEYDRKTVALDMESHSLGILSSNNGNKYIVAKGVGDYAGVEKKKQNRYIEYASAASCRFIIEFFKTL